MIFLVFITPLAVYLLILAMINRSRGPVVVAGTWDCVGLLLALSGFLLLGGPALLTGLYEDWRLFWLLGQVRFLEPPSGSSGSWLHDIYRKILMQIPGEAGDSWYFWLTLWIGYFTAIVAGSVIAILRARARTSVYNIEPGVLGEVLADTLTRLGFDWRPSSPTCFVIGSARPDVAAQAGSDRAVRSAANAGSEAITLVPALSEWKEAPALPGPSMALDLDPFDMMHHATLRWSHFDGGQRRAIEMELRRTLARLESKPSAVGTWMMSVALCLFVFSFLVLASLMLLKMYHLPR